MSNVLYGGGVIDARGSVSGITMSRSRFGASHRAKVSPIQPQSPFQTEARNWLSNWSQTWSQVLTAAQRAAWNSYALTTPATNVFGQTSYLTGHQWFVRLNSNIQRCSGASILVPPAFTSMPGFTALSCTSSHVPGAVLRVFYAAPALPGTPYMYLFASQSLSPGIAYANNQLRFIGALPLAGSPINWEGSYLTRFRNVYPVGGRKTFILGTIVDQASGLQSAGFITSSINA